ncbi:MAG: bifunctional UDP-N-acetylmuramoyl-tripeptide:D-alanyl-D-alanine ligase/alanine racemase [Muribaculaceae bacterium]|nr:bifunctional UDP-N-acetylmuramoyl-tripeptide:D-alanyl-D-alanine ligase/alanine racemase [Muribaculaceae bacterium]
MKYSIQEIAQVLGIETSELRDKNAEVSYLLTDSRSLTYPSETLFFAIATQSDDGHRYVKHLYNKGVRNFVIEYSGNIDISAMREANFLRVSNTLDAIQAIATYHRRRFQIPIIGITGSRGKTTVKEWLYQLLKEDYHIVRSPRSYNSQIGVPLSLWDIDDNTSLAIIEAGISKTGEMARLQAMIRPTIGVITNIGSEHNDGFASMQEKVEEKAKILTSCESIVYCADDELVASTIEPILYVAQDVAWSKKEENNSLFIRNIVKRDNRSKIECVHDGTTFVVDVPFTSDRDLENIATCMSVMLYLGVSHNTIAERVKRLTPVGTRINVIEGVNECTLIVDGYTSDYNSLSPALDFMLRRCNPQQHTTVILSDLLPETFAGDELYIRVSELLRSKGITRLIGIGPEMCRYSKYFNSNRDLFFESTTKFLEKMSQGDFDNETVLVKGASMFEFFQIVEMLEVSRHQTVEEIDLNALSHNFKFLKSKLDFNTKTVAMVKASGYGTGSYEIAKTLQDCGATYLAVAVQDEGVELRKAGITLPIIVLNPSTVNYKAMFDRYLEPEVYSIEEAHQLIKEGKKYGAKNFPVHIKIDSGMHRLGFTLEQLPDLVELLLSQDVIMPVSVFSHLCVADDPEQDDFTREQVEYFDICATQLQANFSHTILRHILNTTGVVRFPEHQMDMARLGVGLYGIKTVFDGSEDGLLPVAELRAIVISIKNWPAGTKLGYGLMGVLERDSRVATVSMGYADGLDRCFGNGNVKVWVNGTLCPTVGNICMDACMIDVTDATCEVGDKVEIFGNHNPIEQLSDARGTIPYEILTSISPRVKRVYFRE